MKTVLPLVALFCASSIAATAAVVFEDNFTSGNRAGWHTFTVSTSASNSVNAGAGSWTLSPQSGTSLAAITYFVPTTLTVGQSIELSLTFSYSVMPPTADTGIRFGLFNSFGTGITADQTGTGANANAAFNDDRGYAAFFSASATQTANTNSVRERSADHSTFWTTSAFTTLGTPESRPVTAINTPYAASLLITYLDANTMSITSTVNGVTVARADSSSLITTFDSISLFTAGHNGNITFSDVVVTSTIPEPSTYAALAGLVGLGLAAHRRRRAG